MEAIEELREQIDAIDAQWVALLGKRFAITAEVGKIKARENLLSTDVDREARQMQNIEKLAIKSGVNPTLAMQVLRAIIDEAVRNHKSQAHNMQ